MSFNPRPGRIGRIETRLCPGRFWQSYHVPFVSIGLIALATALRLAGIARESIWLDEATSLMLARMTLPELIRTTSLDVHPPLYYILLHFWISLGQSEAIIRGLSTVAGVLNVLIIYGLGRILFDSQTGWIAAALLAVAPFHVWYSQEARMYAWVTTLMSASVLLALWFWRGRRWLAWIGYVLVTAAALYTHYYAVFSILVVNLFFVYLLLRGGYAPGWRGYCAFDKRLFWSWAAAQGVVLVLFLPWLPMFLVPMTTGGEGWVTFGAGKPSLAVLPQTAVLYMVGGARAQYPLLVRRLAYVLFVGAFVVGLWPRRRPSRDQGTGARGQPADPRFLIPGETEALGFSLAYLALPLGIAWVSSQILKPMYSARYMLPFLIPFLLLVARGVRNVPWAVARVVLLVALVAVMGVGIAAQVKTLDKPDWRSWSAKLIQAVQKDDLVLFMPGWHAKPFDYYAQGRLSLFSDVPVPVDRYGGQALKVVEKAIAGHPRVWLVWETPHYTDRDGAVYNYLRAHCRQVSETQMPLLGRIILFENPGAAGG